MGEDLVEVPEAARLLAAPRSRGEASPRGLHSFGPGDSLSLPGCISSHPSPRAPGWLGVGPDGRSAVSPALCPGRRLPPDGPWSSLSSSPFPRVLGTRGRNHHSDFSGGSRSGNH